MRRLTTPLASALVLGLLAIVPASASAVPPAIPLTTLSHVTTDSATLEADIDPEGKASQYHFEYGLADCASNPCTSTPAPEGKLAKGEAPVRVEATIEGLTPGTTYHFRVVAKNGNTPADVTTGPDRTLTTQLPPPLFGPCPNDALRDGAPSSANHPSAALPDCRAYEQASPVDKNGVDVTGRVAWLKASPNGNAVSFLSASGIPGGEGGQELPAYLARRGASDWSSHGMLPPAAIGEEALVSGWTPDFSQVFAWSAKLGSLNNVTLTSRSLDGPLTTIVPYGSGLRNPYYAGASADGSTVFFESTGKLPGTEAIEGKSNVYAWDRTSGKVSLASALNEDKAPSEGAFAGSYDWIKASTPTPSTLADGGAQRGYYTQDNHAVSSDGSLYFTAAGTGQLYLRRNPTQPQSNLDKDGNCTEAGKACTIQVSASQRHSGHGEDGTDVTGTQPAAFMAASADGSKVFLTSSEKLTDDATTGPEPSEPPAVARANVNSGGERDPQFLPVKADGLAVFGEYIYWADPGGGTIGRAKLNGADKATDVKADFIANAGIPHYVAVDSEHIYWSNAGDGKDGNGTIARADIDGSPGSVKLDFITGASNPQGVAVDGAHVYWANDGGASGNGCVEVTPGCPVVIPNTTRTVGRADLNGDSPDQRFINTGGAGFQIALDTSHLFIANNDLDSNTEGFGAVKRYDLSDGKYSGEVFEPGQAEGNPPRLRGVAIDDGHVYSAAQRTNVIGRNKLAFSGNNHEEEPEFIPAAGGPKGLAVDTEHIYWSANQEVQPNPGNDLYRYDASTGALIDLTPDVTDKNGAEVKGVLGISADGSYVYFAANGDLDGPGGPATAGDCHGTVTDTVVFDGQCSLYLAHAGTIEFVARLEGSTSDATNWLPRGGLLAQNGKTARVTPDGRTLLFRSTRQLTTYENKGDAELYRYRAGEPGVLCVSCNPTAQAPGGLPGLGNINLAQLSPADPAFVLSRNLSASGNQVFFETTDALLAADSNGEAGCPGGGTNDNNASYPICKDVYEWEAKGAGSCESEAQNSGCLYLLSSGKSDRASFFLDASESGDDAFLITRSPFVGQDEDQLYDVYDARVGGGLSSQNEPPPPICEGEGCKPGATSPPQSESAGTASFAGPLNPKAQKPKPRCPKSKRMVRAKGKSSCVAKHHKRKHRRANANRRASR
jgi:hypothetical protein